jgi:hypothetical protein
MNGITILVTTHVFFKMTPKDIELMSKFLIKFYPISRVKHNMRFRRGILFDDGREYILGDANQYMMLRFKLIETLKMLFLSDEQTCIIVINKYLK